MTLEKIKDQFFDAEDKVLFCESDENCFGYGVELYPELNVVLYGDLIWDGTYDGWAMSCPMVKKASSKEDVWNLIKEDIEDMFFCDNVDPEVVVEKLEW